MSQEPTEKNSGKDKTSKKNIDVDIKENEKNASKTCEAKENQLDEEYNDVDLYKVDIEDEMELAQAFGVMSVPTLLFIPIQLIF